jgi:hypothetical protein
MLEGLLLAAAIACEVPSSLSRVPSGVDADSIRRFPRVEGKNLEGRKLSLPTDFEATHNVVVIAFKREQQADVDTWMPFLRGPRLAQHDVRVYELPTLSRSYRIMRGMIDGGMARGIADKATREATITLYIEKTPFKRALSIANEECITTMLVARDGRVLWRADGRFTEPLGNELVAILEKTAR